MFIGAFFSGQMILQLYWIRQLFTLKPTGYQSLQKGQGHDAAKNQAMDEATAAAVQYAPIYALGNLCIGEPMSNWLARQGLLNLSLELAGWSSGSVELSTPHKY
jgi:hypothetical protein